LAIRQQIHDATPSPVTVQGLTADRVLVHADTSVHTDLLNCRFAYVSISRTSHEATLFTDDMAAKLIPQFGADVSKSSASKSVQASLTQRIGIEIWVSSTNDDSTPSSALCRNRGSSDRQVNVPSVPEFVREVISGSDIVLAFVRGF